MSANFIIFEKTEARLVLRDVGPWDRHQTITNDAEDVVRRLIRAGDLKPDDQELFYFDSEGALAKIVVHRGHFAGFQPILKK